MSGFTNQSIEALIAKAKELGLSRLRVGEGGSEVSIELPRANRAAVAEVVHVASPPSSRDVLSHFVGYFRPAAEPGAAVSKGEIVGVVESLGLPNDILAPISGTLGEFAVAEGDAVEYGTVIIRIES